jgi:hypothetical protein
LYFAYNNPLAQLWYATIVYPAKAATALDLGDRREVLKDGFDWFVRSYFPVIVLTGAFAVFKAANLVRNWSHLKRRDWDPDSFLTVSLVIWCIAGLGAILIQRLSWWEYHYSLLMVPLGVLASKGIENLFAAVGNIQTKRWKVPIFASLMFVVLLAFAPTARRLSNRVRAFNQIEVVRAGSGDLRLSGEIDVYKRMADETRAIALEDPRPKTFVLSNPRYYYLSNTLPAISSNGWMPDGFTETEWQGLDREMSDKKPKYVLVERNQFELVRQLHPIFLADLERNYSVYSTSDAVVIYRLKVPA